MRSKKIGDYFPVCVGKFVSLGHGRILRLKGENSTENQAFRGSGGVSKVFIQSLVVNEIEQNLRFQGQYFYNETGLHYNTYRYYDPAVGRFFTQDPLSIDDGMNQYVYVLNPILWMDPLGLSCGSDAKKLADSLGSEPVSGGQYDAHHIVM